MKKIKYEKPSSLDAGKVAAIQGASCSYGNGATDGCIIGDNPDITPYCQETGNIADGNCLTLGNTAGQVCITTGGTASMGCIAGGTP